MIRNLHKFLKKKVAYFKHFLNHSVLKLMQQSDAWRQNLG